MNIQVGSKISLLADLVAEICLLKILKSKMAAIFDIDSWSADVRYCLVAGHFDTKISLPVSFVAEIYLFCH